MKENIIKVVGKPKNAFEICWHKKNILKYLISFEESNLTGKKLIAVRVVLRLSWVQSASFSVYIKEQQKG